MVGGSVTPDVGATTAGFGVPLDEFGPEARFLSGDARVRICSWVTVTTGETAMVGGCVGGCWRRNGRVTRCRGRI